MSIPTELENIDIFNRSILFLDLFNYYNNDISRLKELFAFGQKNNLVIVINLEDTKLLEKLLQDFFKSGKTKPNDWYDNNGKVNSIDGIVLIRRDYNIPKNDVIEPVSNNYTCKINTTGKINGKQVNFEVDAIAGGPTVHWMMNQEVLSHNYAPDGWKDRTVTVLQPLTEELYNKAEGLNPVDTFFSGSVPLSNSLIICQKSEDAQEAVKQNANSSVVLFEDMFKYQKGIGNLLANCMGYGVFYVTYNGARLDGSRNYISDLYTDSLQKKYPSLVEKSQMPVGTKFHDFGDTMYAFSVTYETIKYIINHTTTDYIEQHSIDELLESLSFSGFINVCHSSLDSDFNNCLNLLPDRYSFIKDFFKKMITKFTFNVDEIFNIVTSGVVVNEENERALIRIKEIIIRLVEEYSLFFKKKYDEIYPYREGRENDEQIKMDVANMYEVKNLYSKCINMFLLLKIISRSPFVHAKVDQKIEYKSPIKYYDFSVILNQKCGQNESVNETIKRIFPDNATYKTVISNVRITTSSSPEIVVKTVEAIDNCSRDINDIENTANKILATYGCNNEGWHADLVKFITNYSCSKNMLYLVGALLTVQKVAQFSKQRTIIDNNTIKPS